MSEEQRKNDTTENDSLDDTDENEVLTLSELLEDQRQLDEVIFSETVSQKCIRKCAKKQSN